MMAVQKLAQFLLSWKPWRLWRCCWEVEWLLVIPLARGERSTIHDGQSNTYQPYQEVDQWKIRRDKKREPLYSPTIKSSDCDIQVSWLTVQNWTVNVKNWYLISKSRISISVYISKLSCCKTVATHTIPFGVAFGNLDRKGLDCLVPYPH